MSRDLKNKIALITGGAEGIGFQIGEYFLKNGAKAIIIVDINKQMGVEAEQKINSVYGEDAAEFLEGDVTKDLDDIFKIVTDKYKSIDILVNNAGVTGQQNVRKVIEVNLLAVIEWSQKFHEHMRVENGGKGGTIINVASILGYLSNSIAVNYSATKHGVLGFTKCFGHKDNFEASGIRVIAICPGYTKTKLTAGISDTGPWQTPEDVGQAAVEMFERADSGSAWMIEGAQPIKEVIFIQQ